MISSYIWTIVKGIMMGIANIIPGVSGGIMAVSLGIYDDMIHALKHLMKEFKKSLTFLLPIGIGAVIGIVGFSYLIERLLSEFTFPTALGFVGLIIGGLPVIFHSFKAALKNNHQTFNFLHGIILVIFFSVVVGMSLMQEPSQSTSSIEISALNLMILFFVGMITASTMVVPGISGSLTLMIIGYYHPLLQIVTGFVDSLLSVNIDSLLQYSISLIPLGLGFVIGLFAVSKGIDYLFNNFPSLTYSGIIGLVLASPIAILLNTNAIGHLQTGNTLILLPIGLVACLVCFFLTYYIGTKEDLT